MASGFVWSTWCKYPLCWKDYCRGFSTLSRQCNQEFLRRSRTPASSIYERESSLCRSSSPRLRISSASQILAMSTSNFCVSRPLFLSHFYSTVLCSNYKDRNGYILNKSGCRLFHVKNTNSEDEEYSSESNSQRKNKSSNNKQNHGGWNEARKLGMSFLGYGSAALFGIFGSFGFAGIWEVEKENNKLYNYFPPELKDGQRCVTAGIIGINMLVFGLWRVASYRISLAKTLTKWFTLSISGSKTLAVSVSSMMLCAFSHKHFLHAFANLYVLTSFSNAWESFATTFRHYLPRDLMTPEKFVAFYVSAGMVASFTSLLVKHIGNIMIPSLGASGAIMGLIGYMCTKMPESRLSILFIPNWSFTASSGMTGIAIFDTLGLVIARLTNWRFTFFDHAAHLGGLLFGIWYARYGETTLYNWSNFVKRKWRDIKRP